MQRHRFVFAIALVLAAGASARADRLITKDGRALECKKARAEGAGYKLTFEHGEIVVADGSQVASVEIEGDMSDYVPANDDEKKKLADGFVRFQGKWHSRPAYEALLEKNFQKSKARTAEIEKHSDWANAWQKESAHFVVRSNTSPELLDYYCELLDAYYALQDQRIGISPTPSFRRAKLAVNIFKSHEEFRTLSPFPGEMPQGVIGFFAPRQQASECSLNFFHNYEEPAQSTWVGLHECTHLLTFLVDQQYQSQIWVNEGVADYFGSSKIERDKKGKITITPGEIQTDRILTVQEAIKREGNSTGGGVEAPKKPGVKIGRDRPFTPLEKLLMLTKDEFDGFEYAHAWSFVYFLNNYENGKYQKSFDKFFKGLYTLEKGLPVDTSEGGKRVKPEDIRTYLLKKLGVKDTAELERQWKNYIAGVTIAGADARLKRGLQSIYARGDYSGALEDLDAAIAGGVQDPRAFAARGQALVVTGKRDEAVKDFEKAVELDPLSGRYRYQLSRAVMGGMASDVMDIEIRDGQKHDDPRAKREAGLATELEPDNERFRAWLSKFP